LETWPAFDPVLPGLEIKRTLQISRSGSSPSAKEPCGVSTGIRSYTNRHALVQEFVPSPDEQRLYDLVSDYLQRPTLYALPAGQRQLMTLILRKLLASSTYAISGTLDGLAKKLEAAAAAAEAVASPPNELPDNLEEFDELATNGKTTTTTLFNPHSKATRRNSSPS